MLVLNALDPHGGRRRRKWTPSTKVRRRESKRHQLVAGKILKMGRRPSDGGEKLGNLAWPGGQFAEKSSNGVLSPRLFSESNPSSSASKGFSALSPAVSQTSNPVQSIGGLDGVFFDRRCNPLPQLSLQRFQRTGIAADEHHPWRW